VEQSLTPWEALYAVAVLVVSVAAVSYAVLAWLGGHGSQAVLLATGGCALTLWSATRLCGPPDD
jgi:hypothetical protein